MAPVVHRDPERRSSRAIAKPVSYFESDSDLQLMETDPIQISRSPPLPMQAEGDVQMVSMTFTEPANLPGKAPLQRPPPVPGEYYFAMKQSPLGAWGKCKLIEVITRDVSRPETFLIL